MMSAKRSKMANDQALIISFDYGLKENELFYELSAKLRMLVDESGLGEYDGHEIAMNNSDGSYYIYGPDARELYNLIRNTIERNVVFSRSRYYPEIWSS